MANFQVADAIEVNSTVLEVCKLSKFEEKARHCILFLNFDDLSVFGSDAKQCEANMGVLIEIKINGVVQCIKKSLHKESCLVVSTLTSFRDYRIHYEVDPIMKTITYQKVKYDPLTCYEAEKCLNDLLEKVYEGIVKLSSEEEIVHCDLTLPNVCFNEEFKVVFIDLT